MALQTITSFTQSNILRDWLITCPDREGLTKAMSNWLFLETEIECFECGETHQRKNLRYYTVGAFANPDELICKNCWNYCSKPTLANPNGENKKWPDYLDINEKNDIMIKSGTIIDQNGCKIGHVKHYNKKHHTGYVTLIGYEDFTELGSLDQTNTVVPIE